jgi:hypothetical protein
MGILHIASAVSALVAWGCLAIFALTGWPCSPALLALMVVTAVVGHFRLREERE